MALVSFNSNRMEIYVSISSIKREEEKDKGVQTKEEEKSINLGKAQIFMDIQIHKTR